MCQKNLQSTCEHVKQAVAVDTVLITNKDLACLTLGCFQVFRMHSEFVGSLVFSNTQRETGPRCETMSLWRMNYFQPQGAENMFKHFDAFQIPHMKCVIKFELFYLQRTSSWAPIRMLILHWGLIVWQKHTFPLTYQRRSNILLINTVWCYSTVSSQLA